MWVAWLHASAASACTCLRKCVTSLLLNVSWVCAGPGVVINPPYIIPQGPVAFDPNAILTQLNAYRAQHSAPALVYDATIAAQVAAFLSTCPGNGVTVEYSPAQSAGTYAELVGAGWSSFSAMLENYYFSGSSSYSYAAPGYQPAAYSFTTIVWVATTAIGCASELCAGQVYYQCDFYPPGNVNSPAAFQQNVLPS